MKGLIIVTMICAGTFLIASIYDEIKYRRRNKK